MTVRESHELVESVARASYGGSAMRGSLYAGLGQAVAVACQIGSVLILSRLLVPADFGMVAMIGPVIAFLTIFQEMGLLQAVIQRKTLTYGQLNTLFWINLGLAAALMLVLFLAAPLIAAFYHQPSLTWLVRALALNMILTALGAQHFALLNRRMAFGKIAIYAGAVAICTLGGSILWALISPTPWALVAGTLVGAGAGTVMVWAWIDWRPARPEIAPGTADLLGFGAGVTGFKLANFLSRNLDNILIGRFWGGAALGFYDRAYKLILFPLNRVAQPLSQVMVPVLSRLQDEPHRYAHAFFRVFGLMQLAILPGVAAMTGLADTAVPFLLGQQWADSAPIFAALGLAALAQPLANPTGWLFVSQGRTTEMAWWGLASAIVTCAAFVWGVRFGVRELALTYAGVTMLKLFPLWFLVSRKGPVGPGTIRSRILPLFCSGLTTYAAVVILRPILSGPAAVQLLGGLIISYAIFAGVLVLCPFGRAVLATAWQLCVQGVETLRRGRTKGAA